MRRYRWLIISLAVVLVLAALGFLLVRGTIRAGWPKIDGEVKVEGLTAPVEVVRDKMGVPHIYAENSHDLFFAQGYVHAQDRFWQMEFWRRIGSGRLAEILGESALPTDQFIRTLGWRRVAEAEAAMLDGDTRLALESYAEGVNAYVASHKRRLGLEFTILGLNGVKVEPEPWTPADTLTWSKVMAWDLGGNMSSELDRLRLQALVGTDMLADYWPEYPSNRPVIVPTDLMDVGQIDAVIQLVNEAGKNLALGAGPGIGSNNWVVSGEKTETGMPILANDPHLGIQMPSIWYEIGLHCERCSIQVAGFSFAGMPGVIIGHNADIAWGVTNLGPDVQDLYVEKVNPNNPDQYEFKGKWMDMQVRYEKISVAGEDEPRVLQVRSTQHGPIINDVLQGAGEEWGYGWQPLALKWTALEPGTLAQAVIMLDKAQDYDQFRQALQLWDIAAQNFVYADIEGNIAYQSTGRIPIRAQGDGTVPVPGWKGDYEWKGEIPFEEMPFLLNPPDGFIVTANNAVVDWKYPYFISSEWAAGYRAQRITDLLSAQETLTLEDMGRIQMDSYNYSAGEVMPYLLALKPEDAELQQALEALSGWDLQMRQDSSPAAVYAAFWARLMDALFADELNEIPSGDGWSQLAVNHLLQDENNRWWDDRTTQEQVETRDLILEKALQEGVSWLKDEYGGKMQNWRYGDFHTATFENQSLGQSGIRFIESIFNRGPFPVDGGPAIVNATSWDADDPAVVTWAPSMRKVIDLNNFQNSLAVHTTGQSGHPYSVHYDDMIPLWQSGESRPMHWDRAALDADAEGTLKLLP